MRNVLLWLSNQALLPSTDNSVTTKQREPAFLPNKALLLKCAELRWQGSF
jgi:hypothetical protein